jgi:hypothetical protein
VNEFVYPEVAPRGDLAKPMVELFLEAHARAVACQKTERFTTRDFMVGRPLRPETCRRLKEIA